MQTQSIVPMGQLIETLGYEMVWNPAGCYLTSPEGQRIKLQVQKGCPQLQELEALSLIARLEDRKLEQLQNTTLTTRDKVNMSMMALERTWQHYLFDYVTTGSFESGLRAVRDAPYLEDLPGECFAHMVPTQGLWSGCVFCEGDRLLDQGPTEETLHLKALGGAFVRGQGRSLENLQARSRRYHGD